MSLILHLNRAILDIHDEMEGRYNRNIQNKENFNNSIKKIDNKDSSSLLYRLDLYA